MSDENAPDKATEKETASLDRRVKDAIKSLKFRTNKKIEVEGAPTRYVQDERAMKPADVLSATEVDGQLVIVSADGRKHRVAA
jgi:hypothetical protein